MKTHLSKIIFFGVGTVVTFLPTRYFLQAQTVPTSAGTGGGVGGGQYKQITPGGFFKNSSSFEAMLTDIFNISVTFTIMLAVVMIIAGGIQYMGSESIFAKGAGKEKIFAALGGLLIVLTCVLLIGTILGQGSGNGLNIVIFGK